MASPLDLENLDYVHLIPYNGSGPTGGDSLTEDLNIWYEVRRFQIRSAQTSSSYGTAANKETQTGDIGWMITATALVLLMIPGVGYGQFPP